MALDQAAAECAQLVDRYLQDGIDGTCRAQVLHSLDVVTGAFERHPLEELALSYNGGKDCLVMLVITLAALHRHCLKNPQYLCRTPKFQTVYVQYDHSFAEVDQFVDTCSARYALEVTRIPGPMKPALSQFLEKMPCVKAIFVGIRRSDPYGQDLEDYQLTSAGWPAFMRVHPVLEWQYGHIWHFLRTLNIAYCSLYDQGFSSLGSTTTTIRNPALQSSDGRFRPAYMLESEEDERRSRV